jgi:hypothetical protein
MVGGAPAEAGAGNCGPVTEEPIGGAAADLGDAPRLPSGGAIDGVNKGGAGTSRSRADQPVPDGRSPTGRDPPTAAFMPLGLPPVAGGDIGIEPAEGGALADDHAGAVVLANGDTGGGDTPF